MSAGGIRAFVLSPPIPWGWGSLDALRSRLAHVCLHSEQLGHEGRPWPRQGAAGRLPVLRLRRPGSGSLSHVCSCHQWGRGLETWGQSLAAGASDEQFRTSDPRACVSSWCPGPTATPRPAGEGPLQRAGGAQGSDTPAPGGHQAWLLLAARKALAPGGSGCCQLWVLVGPCSPAAPADGRGDPMPRP